MEKKKKKISKNLLLTISLIVLLTFMATLPFTLAWFKDNQTLSSTVNFGAVEIDTTSGVATQSAVSYSVTRTITTYSENGNLMPGDTITLNVRIKLTSDSEPSYYLVRINGRGAAKDIVDNNYYYLNGDDELTMGNANQTCGSIDASTTINLSRDYIIPLNYEKRNVSGTFVCAIAAIQKANLAESSAYSLLSAELSPVGATITKTAIDTYKSTVTELGFYAPFEIPSGYSLSEADTTALQANLAVADQNKISVYKNSSTQIAFVCKGLIYAPTNCSELFKDYTSLTAITFNNFDTRNTTSMSSMFQNDMALTSLDLTNFDTSNVTSMNTLVGGCLLLTEIDLSNFDTSQVTNMSYMFSGCRSLVNLNISNFDTSKVTRMDYMFCNCDGLTRLDLSHFNTGSLTKIEYIFSSAENLLRLDLTGWDLSRISTWTNAFDSMSSNLKILCSADSKDYILDNTSLTETNFY